MSKRLDAIEKMLAAGSTEPFHHYARAMELRSLGRKDEALAAFAGVAERFAGYVPTYLMAAQLAAELGRKEESAGFADRGIAAAQRAGDDHALSELTTFRSTL
jgi:hypothetical protein